MHRTARLLLGAVMLVVLAGCDQLGGKFEIVRAGTQTFILNKATGEAQLVEGVTLVKVKLPEVSTTDEATKKAKNWPTQDIPQLGDIKLTVRTKYRDVQMLYEVNLAPFQGRLEKEFNGVPGEYLRQPTMFVDFYDEEGFRTGDAIELKIRGGGGTRVVNQKGETYALSWTGSQSMTLETYRASKTQNVRWAGFGKE